MSAETHVCEHDDCTSTETQQFVYPIGDESTWLCDDHIADGGFCIGCHHFCAGTEDYDFSPLPGWCGECYDELRYETGEYDDDDDYGIWDYYPHNWHDPDVDSSGEDSTHTYIGEDREELG